MLKNTAKVKLILILWVCCFKENTLFQHVQYKNLLISIYFFLFLESGVYFTYIKNILVWTSHNSHAL